MKISPVYPIDSFVRFVKSNDVNLKTRNICFQEPKNELPKIPVEYFYSKNKIKPQNYSYKPVSSVKPITSMIGHYDDLDKFCELFAAKLNSNLLIPSENDIANLISRIKSKTNAPDSLIRQVLADLSAFSGYKSLGIFNSFIKNNNIKDFGLTFQYADYDTCDVSSNAAIEYLISKKQFLTYPKAGEEKQKTAYILDDSSLSQLEKYKNSPSRIERLIYDRFIKKLDDYVFVIPQAWDIKTKNDGYKNANMFSGSGYLEDLATETIKRIQSGENPHDIYYSDFKERLSNLIDDENLKKCVNIFGLQPKIQPEQLTDIGLANSLSPRSISKDYIKTVIESYIDVKKSDYTKQEVQEALLKYLDEMTIVYSTDSLCCSLKKLGRNIESMLRKDGYDKKDIIYIIPLNNKSYSLISLMYAQINGIDPKNITSSYNITDENILKPKVILDDLSASGASEESACFDIRIRYKVGKSPIIYAPLVLCNQAEDHSLRNSVTNPNGYIFDKYVFDMSHTGKLATIIKNSVGAMGKSFEEELSEFAQKNHKVLTPKDFKILNDLLFKGYGGNALSIIFPYMIPDNASDISSLLLGDLLFVENASTNKGLSFLYGRKEANQKEYDDMIKIIDKIDKVYKK